MKLAKVALAFVVAAAGLVVAPARADAVAFVSSVASGSEHNCALTSANEIYCWGKNSVGQLGDGTTSSSSSPVLVSGSHAWASVSASVDLTCAVTTAGDGYCWGTDNYGQVGAGTHGFYWSTPQLVSGSHVWASISAGDGTACGVTTAGAGYCWGYNNYGQLGDNTTTNADTPQSINGARVWQSVTVGLETACGVEVGGDAYCWGKNTGYGLGIGTSPAQVHVPTLVTGSHSWTSITAGDARGCAITNAAAGYCWGAGFSGDGTTNQNPDPALLDGAHTWTQISAGNGIVCGLDNSNDAYCWGYNSVGSVGDGTTTNRASPTLVAGSHDFVDVSTGSGGGCGVTTSSAVYCWGWNTSGQLGDGTTTNRLVPVVVIGLSAARANATVSGIVDPSLTFTVVGRATVCNGQSGAGFQTGSSSSSVSLGHLNPTVIGGGAQDLTLATNAANGFVVYIRTSGTTPNAFSGNSRLWLHH